MKKTGFVNWIMDKLQRLIEILCAERGEKTPTLTESVKPVVFRALCNVRPPMPASEEFVKLQDEYLQEVLSRKGITDANCLQPVKNGLYLRQGDITTLKCDAIVNAANSRLLGCFYPNHGCIDNAIHTCAGVQLRLECAEIMKNIGRNEDVGQARITKAYNLPSKYILHTVGPFVQNRLTEEHENQLANCYRSCLALADEKNLNNIAFCCISTGEFRFPNVRAAEIAVRTVTEYLERTKSGIKIIFNVFKDIDYAIYEKLLKPDGEIA